jgi:hypothetical protein
MNNLAAEAATAEVLVPKLATTEQILSVHRLLKQDDRPIVIWVDETIEEGAFHAYFQLENEPYYLVVVLRRSGEQLVAATSYIQAAVRVFLTISSDTLEPDKITELLGLTPDESHAKGETRDPRRPYLRFKQHRWVFHPDKTVPGSLEDKLSALLNQLEPVQAKVASLQDQCGIHIGICYEGYQDWMGGVHLTAKTISRLADLKADIDLDLYASGPDMPES